MAKICKEERAAIERGYAVASQFRGRGIPASERNPAIWSSVMWEAHEFGLYIAEKGITLGDSKNWERGRGNTYRNADGFTFKLSYSGARARPYFQH